MDELRYYIKDRVSIDETSGCWVWTRSVASHGYGNACWKKKPTVAHRLSYEAFVGEIPEGHQIDHLCKNRRCVNPEHLEAVTQQLNIRRQFGGTEDLTKCPNGHSRQHTYRDAAGKNVCRICRKENYGNQKKVAAVSE